jgi:monoamine oxidase
MARTRLFSIAQRALSAAGASHDVRALSAAGASHDVRALSRRQALLFGGAATLAACAPLEDVRSLFASRPAPDDIAIVGGGVAGLTAAYRLSRAGKRATLYEASPRFGGRMFTKRNFNSEGQFCELGGELVDSNHRPLMDLAAELGVGMQLLKSAEGAGESLYALGGKLHSDRDLLHRGKGAFVPVARRIARDKEKLFDTEENWTDHARTLDAMSLRDYLAQFRGRTADWVIELLDIAYWGEYGLPTNEQSALNLVDFIGTDTAKNFEMFGESDEAYRIAGGSSSLPDALYARLGDSIRQRLAHGLSSIAHDGARFALTFTAEGKNVTASHAVVVLALPFTKLREVNGIDTLGLSAPKLKCIRELGYGDNGKVMIGTTSRPWTDDIFPVKAVGEFYSREFQVMWDTSRGQDGTRGILTNYLSGVQDLPTALAGIRAGMAKFPPAMAASLDESNIATFFWARYPFNKGSFTCPRVGQYTTLLEVAGTPELGGRLQFAGEHTSADFAGFMCGGVDSGERVAKAILEMAAASADTGLRDAA